MDQLSTVNLSSNQIANFQLKSTTLHILDLSNNKISQFPEIPATVTDLKMSKNQLKDIPDDMQLPNLKNLDMSENQITGIPKSLGALKLKSKLRVIQHRMYERFYLCSSQHEAKSSQGQEAL
jgi:Leucine-rich repeat (LRR) protein